MDADTFEALFQRVRNWGRWGEDDQRGTLNLLDDAARAAAALVVRSGRTVSLSHDLDTLAGPDNGRPALHYMTQQCDVALGEPRVNTDFIGVDFHGKSVTHVDALCHCSFRGRLYNGIDSSHSVDSTGGSVGTVEQMRDGVVGRGVLVDLPRARGAEWVEPGAGVGPDELVETLAAQGTARLSGDIVLVRTGHRRRREVLGAWDPSHHSAGLAPESMEWLHASDAALLGGDGDSDSRPSSVDGVDSPIHALALAAMGLPLIDNMNLEDLAQACSAEGRWDFLFVMAPLRVPGGTGSPVNPLAVL
ncbi:cyclase family protein [Nocardioides zhouii]|uniref:cyclase family protein n=1 Tax=Nocardioides zhouii TaxID=1168729 RepID=UPI001A915488|nr:cyclase family protein [Nocardioides zhouii]